MKKRAIEKLRNGEGWTTDRDKWRWLCNLEMSSAVWDWIGKSQVGRGESTEETSWTLFMKRTACPSREIWLHLVGDGCKWKVRFKREWIGQTGLCTVLLGCDSLRETDGRQEMAQSTGWRRGRRDWSDLALTRKFVKIVLDSMGVAVHGILQARILGWAAIPFPRGASRLRDWARVSCIAGRFVAWAPTEALRKIRLF